MNISATLNARKILLSILTITTFGFGAKAQFQQITPIDFDGAVDGSVTFADMDGDNDQDVIITGTSTSLQGTSKLYRNDGNGVFTEILGSPFVGVYHSSVAIADVNGDNYQDILITGYNNSNQATTKLYTNNGNGFLTFTEATGTPFEDVYNSAVAFADIDNDNDLDVLITGYNNSAQRIAKLYTNNGNGIFTEVIGTPFVGVLSTSIAFADIDGDSDQDVLITGQNSANQIITKLYSNNGSGIFTEVTSTSFDGVIKSSIAFADIDGDNDQDVLITGQNNSNQKISKLYTNDGSGVFTELTGLPFDGVVNSSIAFADIDNDNDQDLLITGENTFSQRISKLYINNGSGTFTITGTPFENITRSSIAFADIDGDNDQDVLISGEKLGNYISFAYRNNTTVFTNSIIVQGQAGATTITTNSGTLQMLATVSPANATDNTRPLHGKLFINWFVLIV